MKYVLITPARNEEETLPKTIQSVLSQSLLPERWVIVSDGSTDHTDEIVKRYLPGNPWINFVRMPEHRGRHFAAKVRCFEAAYATVRNLDFTVIGNLDGDITFDPDYFEFLMDRFAQDPKLGVAGTPFMEEGQHYDYRFTNIEHVSGACQLFRRACFEAIGGYLPIEGGGIDWVAVTTARMKGWKTRTFTERTCMHHRRIGTGNANRIWTWFRQGCKDYALGNHPLWEGFRAFYQMAKRPLLIRGGLLMVGYLSAFLKRTRRPISLDLIQFVRKEQMQRLKGSLSFGPSREVF